MNSLNTNINEQAAGERNIATPEKSLQEKLVGMQESVAKMFENIGERALETVKENPYFNNLSEGSAGNS